MNKLAVVFICILVITNTTIIAYTTLQSTLRFELSFRFFVLTIEHLYFLGFFLFYHCRQNLQLKTILLLVLIGNLGNLLLFAFTQIFMVIHYKSEIQFFENREIRNDLLLNFYAHFYYQINIYFIAFTMMASFTYLIYLVQECQQQKKKQKIQRLSEILRERSKCTEAIEQSCSICLKIYEKQELVCELQCHHVYHLQCLKEWIKQKTNCPLCRQQIEYQ